VRKDIGSSKMEQILKAYPEINPDWFLTGEGNMLKSGVPTTSIKESKSLTIRKTEIRFLRIWRKDIRSTRKCVIN
jgi:hypothetical protein